MKLDGVSGLFWSIEHGEIENYVSDHLNADIGYEEFEKLKEYLLRKLDRNVVIEMSNEILKLVKLDIRKYVLDRYDYAHDYDSLKALGLFTTHVKRENYGEYEKIWSQYESEDYLTDDVWDLNYFGKIRSKDDVVFFGFRELDGIVVESDSPIYGEPSDIFALHVLDSVFKYEFYNNRVWFENVFGDRFEDSYAMKNYLIDKYLLPIMKDSYFVK